jgi:hypothetical protein
MCHWILKAKGMGDTDDVLEGESVAFLIASKLLRSITFYPLLTAALMLYQDLTERFIKERTWAQVVRGIVAVLLIGVYFYMFGFHYIFLREMEPNLVFYTTLPQVLLFLLIYTRLGSFTYKWIQEIRAKCRRGPILPSVQKSNGGQVSLQTTNGDTGSYEDSPSVPTERSSPGHGQPITQP